MVDQAVAESLRNELAAVVRAEARIADGTYGISVESGERIPDERLEAEPLAERTVQEQSRFERTGSSVNVEKSMPAPSMRVNGPD